MDLSTYRKKLDRHLMDHRHLVRSIKEDSTAVDKSKQRETDVLEAQRVVQEVAEKIQNTAHQQIASVVSKCLESVFGPDRYQFKIVFERKRGKTEGRLTFVKDGHELDPIDETEQGVVDVAGLALQLTKLVLSRPPRRRFLCLDEPLKHLNGEEWRGRVKGMIEALSKEMGIQFLIFTQRGNDLAMGKVINLEENE